MMGRIRIGVWLNYGPEGGGTFQYALSAVLALHDLATRHPDRYEVVLFSPQAEWKTFAARHCGGAGHEFVLVRRTLLQKVVNRVIRHSDAALALWRSTNGLLPSAYRAIYRRGVDLMICPAQDALSYEVKLPTVSTIHDLMHRYESDFPEACCRRTARYRDWHYRRMCRFARVVVVDSKLGGAQVVESYGDALKAKVLPLSFLPAPYVLQHDRTQDFSSIRTKYGLPESYVFYPAQFWEHKNHHRLVAAIKLLKDKGIVVNAVFVGAAKNNYERVCKMVEDSGLREQVKMLGYVPDDDIVGLYKNARALVMPTFFGPTNIPPLEAFYLGVPVACSGIYAMPEQLGNAALLFDPKSVEDIAEKVDTLWTDARVRKELIERGYDLAKNMTIENHARRWQEIIEVVVYPSDAPADGRSVRSGQARNLEPAGCS
jgi:glycosyltransferase involved in cell wall biosynthesis